MPSVTTNTRERSPTWSVILMGPVPITAGTNGTLNRGSFEVSGDDSCNMEMDDV